MSRGDIFALLVFSITLAGSVRAQDRLEDVVVLKDSSIFRGTVSEDVAPGSPVNILRSSGKTASIFWPEILTIQRLPVSMPDSVIAAVYLRSERDRAGILRHVFRSPGGYRSGPAAQDSTEEDVVILVDGTMLRGTVIGNAPRGGISLWTSGRGLIVLQRPEIQKNLHVARDMTDSTIDVMYVHPRPEMVADDFRILTVFGGFSAPVGGFAFPGDGGGTAAGTGFVLGLHESVRLIPAFRWATSVLYANNALSVPYVPTQFSASGKSAPHQTLWIMTGEELRTEGTEAMKAFAFIQGGMFFSQMGGFAFTVPETRNHPGGSGWQVGAHSNGAAFCAGVGVSMGRLSLTGRWLTGTAHYENRTTISFNGYDAVTWFYTYDQPLGVVTVSLGFSPF